jgi:2-polyprenyl-6-methoxyphenol hydroxylase-like FAD-dependent oxidoreductase
MNQNVLVAGAGPVGLTMAAELARYGVPVRIIDKARAVEPHPGTDRPHGLRRLRRRGGAQSDRR